MSHLHKKQPTKQETIYTAVIGRGMLRNNALLSVLLRQPVKRWYPWYMFSKQHKQTAEQFAGWGLKKSYNRAYHTAKRLNKPTVSVEDGFLRSIDTGIGSRFGCSVVVDDMGIYFDASQPSVLEQHILTTKQHWSADKQQRATHCMDTISKHRLSKYNKALLTLPKTLSLNPNNTKVLVVDQVLGDASINGAGATQKQFRLMLKQACRDHTNADIYIKAHPAAKIGYLVNSKSFKYLSKKDQQRIQVIDSNVNPILLLKQMNHVYTVSSHMGFEALMLGIKVHCFGVAWYSGWGITDDTHAPSGLLQQVKHRRLEVASGLTKSVSQTKKIGDRPAKNKNFDVIFSLLPFLNRKRHVFNDNELSATLEQLFYAAYIEYSRYADPASSQSCEIEHSMQWLITNRDIAHKLPQDLIIYEFSRWKIPFVHQFLSPAVSVLKIKPKPRLNNLLPPKYFMVDYQQSLLVWGLAKRMQLEQKCQNDAIVPNIWCMEDGFIRSNGLGATLLAPLSVVIDRQGIYYDATRPSDLETLLVNCAPLSEQQQRRVEGLQELLLARQVSKYNVGQHAHLTLASSVKSTKQEIILIVGQVEDDLSVQYCGSLITTNAALIRRVRADNPTAYLIYKPHPDVEAGLRIGKVDQHILSLVDDVAHNIAIAQCLAVIDSVHTISSLTGFEALLRDKQVVCYGMPFYAGWGLTIDKDSETLPKSTFLARRQRATPLTLEQLIHCVLIDYPLYRLPNGYGLAQVEQVIDYLYNSSVTSPNQSKKRHLTQLFMQARKYWQNFRH